MSAIFGEKLIFGQHNGPDLELKVYGDEFYARYEALNGYTVVYDLDQGRYCYAVIEDGRFISSGTPVSKPVPYGIRRHLREHGAIRNEKFRKQYEILRPRIAPLSASSNVMRTYGPNSGLLEGRQVAHGDVCGLTILVEFDNLHTNITDEDVDALLNDENYRGNGNFCSVNEYYKLMSNGKFNYTNKVVGPVRLSRRQSYYINNLLLQEALQIAIEEFNLDLAEFDSTGAGIVDAISLMYAGRSLYAGMLWPHNFYQEMFFGNYRTYFYTIQSLGRNRVDLSIGTFAHESGHMLCRFPDLYDYGERDEDFEESSGLGEYCLMSYGNHLGGGKRPSPICAYLRDLVGWCDNEVNLNNPGQYEAKHGDYRTVMRFSTDRAHEYFLVENRNQDGLDQYLPDSGLAIYHCDTRGSNEYQDGTPDNHYQCALIQADGRFDLENTVRGGDDGDLYESVQGIALSDETVPDSKEWDGSDSGLSISDIGPSGVTIPFQIGGEICENIITRSVVADLIIPDDNPAGVHSEISIDDAGTLLNIKVEVQITHTYRGDLRVQLEAPSGKTVTLHSNQGGHLDNLHLSLDSKNFLQLAVLAGESIKGKWKLHVSDLLRDDVGRLDTWGLTIEYQSPDQISIGEANPRITIPDDNSNGVQSSILIADTGNVKGLSVEVDISHTYKGDVQIELIAPSGQRALLRSSNRESGRDILETYSETSTASLGALIGEETKGDWVLHVRDLVFYDEGILNRWAIMIRR
jgi:M6 family metalloprotease-like protein